MKLRVVDWVDYDDDYPDGDIGSWAARNAIIDDIRAHGYLFSGWAHQEGAYCTPLLNDGKIYRYSQRGWGDVMAEAHGETDGMSYCNYAFMMDSKFETRPDFDPLFDDEFETDLAETFRVQLSPAAFESARNERKITFADFETLRYIDKGDSIELTSGDESAKYLVADVCRTCNRRENEQPEFVLTVSLAK